ncbi:Hsp33 family molecular chaperone HslO [Roseomonas sp. OT10]|uniref:Hsp33 family molecular chaperone HslO n=1 Tax=Roseomonas cutis TaxID=2897332 RepID=UPI001E58AF05|nr:Hsp33 family molecular chaperone HslO [Roseomonas sp. OT10]UFN47006.1 Hsp33 family molecular chaperone HslO [Roseomonas sp. OT10]
MSDPTQPSRTPDFLNHDRPPVPDLVVPRGLQPFHLEDRPVRGRLVRLGPLAEALLSRHDYAPDVARLLGQALALTAGLAGALKFRGSFSLQAKGDGPVPMLLADCTDGGALRGYARVEEGRAGDAPEGDAASLLGKGYLAFTCDQGADMDRYQGIVAITGRDLAEMTGAYFETSEQIAAWVRLAAAPTPQGWRATALILERVAGQGGIGAMTAEEQAEAWNTATILASTVTEAELLDDSLPGEELLHRLFHAEGLVTDRARALSYGCRCSRARLASVLQGFAEDDLDHMAEGGAITMTCEFCNVAFRFDRMEVRPASGRA